MVSDNNNFEQFEQPGEDIVNLGEMIRYTTTLENFSHEISPDKPSFLVENDDLITVLKYKQGLPGEQIYDLNVFTTALARAVHESREKKQRDKDYKGEVWEQFLKNRLSGLVVILYLNDEPKARVIYKTLTDYGLTSVYLVDCKFGLPQFSGISDKISLEKCLKKAYSEIHSASVSLQDFENQVKESVNIPPISTGYKKLDELLDGGLYPGLYVIGAETSLGKSTFCLNLATNISSQGRSVMYFSIEMSKFELTGRMLSRETYILSQAARERGHAQTSRTLTTGTKFEKLSDLDKHLVENSKILFQAKAKNLYLFENIGEMYYETVQKAVLDFMERTGTVQPPVVIIDYLQILRFQDKYIDSNDKLKTDKNLFLLKKFSNDYKLPIIAVSSLNRDQTKKQTRLKMSAFKESGAIEYTADTLIGLQLEQTAFWGESSVSKTSEELQKDVRDIDLVILKNRHGKRDTHSHFKYHTWFNDFKEVPGFDVYPSKEELATLTTRSSKKNSPDDDEYYDDDDGLLT